MASALPTPQQCDSPYSIPLNDSTNSLPERPTSPTPLSKQNSLRRSLSYRSLHTRLDSSEASPSEHSSIYEATAFDSNNTLDLSFGRDVDLLDTDGLYGAEDAVVLASPQAISDPFWMGQEESGDLADQNQIPLSPLSHSRWPASPLETITEQKSQSTMRTTGQASSRPTLRQNNPSSLALAARASTNTLQADADMKQKNSAAGSSLAHQRSVSLDDDCLRRMQLHSRPLTSDTPFSSEDTVIPAVDVDNVGAGFPNQPTHPPLARTPTPPGLPSFGSREAMDMRGTRIPRSVSTGIAHESLSRIQRSLGSEGRSDDSGNGTPAMFRWLSSSLSSRGSRSCGLPPGVVARADDGTAVRGTFGARQSGHGVGASGRGLAFHPWVTGAGIEKDDDARQTESNQRSRDTLHRSQDVLAVSGTETAVVSPLESPSSNDVGACDAIRREPRTVRVVSALRSPSPGQRIPLLPNESRSPIHANLFHSQSPPHRFGLSSAPSFLRRPFRGILKRSSKIPVISPTPVEFPDGTTYTSPSIRRRQSQDLENSSARIPTPLQLQIIHRDGCPGTGSQDCTCGSGNPEIDQVVENLRIASDNREINRTGSVRSRRGAFSGIDMTGSTGGVIDHDGHRNEPPLAASLEEHQRDQQTRSVNCGASNRRGNDTADAANGRNNEDRKKTWWHRLWTWLLLHLCNCGSAHPVGPDSTSKSASGKSNRKHALAHRNQLDGRGHDRDICRGLLGQDAAVASDGLITTATRVVGGDGAADDEIAHEEDEDVDDEREGNGDFETDGRTFPSSSVLGSGSPDGMGTINLFHVNMNSSANSDGNLDLDDVAVIFIGEGEGGRSGRGCLVRPGDMRRV